MHIVHNIVLIPLVVQWLFALHNVCYILKHIIKFKICLKIIEMYDIITYEFKNTKLFFQIIKIIVCKSSNFQVNIQ